MPTIVTKCNADMCNSWVLPRELLLCPDITVNDCEKHNKSIYLPTHLQNIQYTYIHCSALVVGKCVVWQYKNNNSLC